MWNTYNVGVPSLRSAGVGSGMREPVHGGASDKAAGA
jgi:hypothetical protein